MVNDSAQLYTIEGLASAILMVTTVYLVLSSTTILTPGETHITDLQLEQIGYDALAVMDVPEQYGTVEDVRNISPLSVYIQTNNQTGFRNTMLSYLNTKTGGTDTLNFSASVWYRSDGGSVREHPFDTRDSYRQNSVKVTRWVMINNTIKDQSTGTVPPDIDMAGENAHIVLLEVLIWRD